MKNVFDTMKKLLLSDISSYKVVIVFSIGLVLLVWFMVGWMLYQLISEKPQIAIEQCRPVEVEKPKPKPEPVPKVEEQPRPEIMENYYIGTCKFDGKTEMQAWFFQLNKAGIEAVRKGNVELRLFVGYCQYNGVEMDADGWVTVPTEWMPSLDESRISVGLFKITNKPDINSGYYLSSFLIKKAGSNAPKGVVKELKVDPASEEGSVQNVKEEIPMEEMIAIAKLRKGEGCYLWIIPQCPICGEEHEHGGGPLGGNPDDFLGSRVPHCLNPGGVSSYRLVKELDQDGAQDDEGIVGVSPSGSDLDVGTIVDSLTNIWNQ
jgi:hypothetical protein